MRLHHLGLALCFASSLACGGGGGAVVQPKDYKSTEALGGEAPVCKGAPAFARPLTVDLDSDTRSDLQASMAKGVVVVAYDCVHFRVLSNCTAALGDYEYGRVDRKEEVVQIKGLDDLKVNMPLGAAKLGGEVQAGRSIDIALVSIGRQSTTVFKIPKADLTGQCEGATHYVQKAFLGAFSVATAANGKVSGVAEMFSRSVAGSSEQERKGQTTNGSLEACRKAEAQAAKPTDECRTALRVELTPLEAGGGGGDAKAAPVAEAKKDPKGKVDLEENPCRDGYKLVDGLCTNAASAAKRGFLCDPKNEAECKDECSKGNAPSCANAGLILLGRAWKTSHEKAAAEAMPFLKKACDLGDQNGCAGLVRAQFPWDQKEAAKKISLVNELLVIEKKACDSGVGMACHDLGTFLSPAVFEGLKWTDADQSTRAWERGCGFGYSTSCDLAGRRALEKGEIAKGLAFFNRGCDGGDAFVCDQLAKRYMYEQDGITKDFEKGAVLARRACKMNIEECEFSADLLATAGKNDEAIKLATRGCEDKDTRTNLDEGEQGRAQNERGQACYLLGKFYSEGKVTSKDPAKARAAFKTGCDNGDKRACDRKK